MDYFIIAQDESADQQFRFAGLKSTNKIIEVTPDQADDIQDITIVFVEGQADSVYPDYIGKPVVLVADEVKKVLELHDPKLVFKCAILSDPKHSMQKVYWLLLLPRVDCLSERTEFQKTGAVKRIVIDQAKAAGHAIFRVQGLLEKHVFIPLDVAESLLRRELLGIRLEKVEQDRGDSDISQSDAFQPGAFKEGAVRS
ncbi:hypothetical protein NDS46_04840 [Paenibacillus thiaminolyticus]|uniref:hypothetical protein n=1 Tax=Paenibacillus thiaminolyticus TaxID=49283 RepID=UPI002330BB76|nr:hypothetical protein [Paenibacillus thiaminolyticus]WCF09233.1 hypothetical protein NDS46_04840 [Paenibacillus thiaminolyticus]